MVDNVAERTLHAISDRLPIPSNRLITRIQWASDAFARKCRNDNLILINPMFMQVQPH